MEHMKYFDCSRRMQRGCSSHHRKPDPAGRVTEPGEQQPERRSARRVSHHADRNHARQLALCLALALAWPVLPAAAADPPSASANAALAQSSAEASPHTETDAGSTFVTTPAALVLTLPAAQDLAVANSSDLRTLHRERNALVFKSASVNDELADLQSLYDLLPRYRLLHDKSLLTTTNPLLAQYSAYSLQLAGLSQMLAALPEPKDPVQSAALQAQLLAISQQMAALGLTEAQMLQVITPAEQYELGIYAEAFGKINLSSPVLSSEEEYAMFIAPLHVVPHQMGIGIAQYDLGLQLAEARLRSGTADLWDGLAAVRAAIPLLEGSLNVARSSAVHAQERFQLGMIPRLEADAVHRAVRTAEIMRLQRDRQELLLQWKTGELVGINPFTSEGVRIPMPSIALEPLPDSFVLKPLDDYVSRALENRFERRTLLLSIQEKDHELEWMAKYLDEDDRTRMAATLARTHLDLQLKTAETAIRTEITSARLSIESLLWAEAAANALLEQTRLEEREIRRQAEVGFVSSWQLEQLALKTLHAEFTADEARRKTHTAFRKLEEATGIGPAATARDTVIGRSDRGGLS